MKTKIPFIITVLLFVPFASCFSGDHKRPKDLPPLYSCLISITQEGVPLEGANVDLYPITKSRWSVGGFTDDNGTAVISTNGFFPGAPVGKYKVVVKKTAIENRNYLSVVNKIFQRVDTTSLEIEVVKGKNLQSFDVGPAVRDITGKIKNDEALNTR